MIKKHLGIRVSKRARGFMDTIQGIASVTSFLANLAELGAGSIAIYLFLFKRRDIKTVFNMLINYSFQITLSELKTKLDKLMELQFSQDKEEIINTFHDIVGQMKGNSALSERCNGIIERIEQSITVPKKMNEGVKRSFVSELREVLRDADVIIYQKNGENYE